jgi:hypothetical protein
MIAESLMEALDRNQSKAAQKILHSTTGSERIMIYEFLAIMCEVQKKRHPAELILPLLMDHPKLPSTVWANYFLAIHKMAGSLVKGEARGETQRRIFDSAIEMYITPPKGTGQISRDSLNDFIIGCPGAGRQLLSALVLALSEGNYSYLETFATACSFLFQVKAGTSRFSEELASSILQQLASVPVTKIPQELFILLPTIILRSRKVPHEFSVCELSDLLRQRLMYPEDLVVKRQVAISPKKTQTEIQIDSLSRVIEFLKSQENELGSERERRKDVTQKIHSYESKLTEKSKIHEELRIKLVKRDEEIRLLRENNDQLTVELEKVRTDRDAWRYEHELLEHHSDSEPDFIKQQMLSKISQHLGSQLINLRDNLLNTLKGDSNPSRNIKSISVSFNRLCKEYNRLTIKCIETIPNELIKNYNAK